MITPPAKSAAAAVWAWPFWANLANQPTVNVPRATPLTTPSTTMTSKAWAALAMPL